MKGQSSKSSPGLLSRTRRSLSSWTSWRLIKMRRRLKKLEKQLKLAEMQLQEKLLLEQLAKAEQLLNPPQVVTLLRPPAAEMPPPRPQEAPLVPVVEPEKLQSAEEQLRQLIGQPPPQTPSEDSVT